MASLRLDRLTKRFGAVTAVAGLDLDVERGELVSLLGPSGCGKTTTLRLVAGLARPDAGEVWLDGERITDRPAAERGMGMVFQSWALFPNMTAAENIAFPLRVRGVPAAQRARRVAEIVALVGLEGLEGRYPHQLSGGQQQRVGLGRALARDPRVLLLDEPLSALDAPVRRALVVEIRRLQQALGITALYVTHDQEEALGMSDRVAVMAGGRLVEVGTPEQLYRAPACPFTAAFIGAANLVVGTVEDPRRGLVRVGELVLTVAGLTAARPGDRVRVSLRPEELRVLPRPPAPGTPALRGRVLVRTFMGAATRLEVAGCGARWRADLPSEEASRLGGEVWLAPAGIARVVERLGEGSHGEPA